LSRRAWVGAALTAALTLGSVAVFTIGDEGRSGNPVPESTASVFVTKGCVGCHRFEDHTGNYQVGPDLTALDKVAAYRVEGLDAEAYVRQSIREPQAFVVPGYGFEMPTLPLSDAEIDQIVALLLAPDSS
jgi:cytochrome c551/c552